MCYIINIIIYLKIGYEINKYKFECMSITV